MDSLVPIVVFGAVVAGFVQGLSGFAFSLVAASIWAWTVSPQLFGPLVVFASLIGQLIALPTLRRGFDLANVAPFVLGGLAGVPIGVALLPHIEPAWFKFGVGLLLVIYSPIMLAAGSLPALAVDSRLADGASGLAGGVLGGIGGMTGMVPTLWLTVNGSDRARLRATVQAFNVVMHSTTLTIYLLTGAITAEAAHLFLVVAPAMAIPTFLGARLYDRISDAAFRRVVLILLFFSGLTLLAASAPTVLHRVAG